ncbi:hypothetical protein BHE90_007927 [Fusarium euwallaceae]|uniref:Uncharacterized protein n=1 Tax=Fusarium euwallaceae TaxID=1147111 RepID=A0A430LPL0_9HYPO|nr:hypothetical protein BHE90_007927 [Fusarium euwallaceae]
MCAQRTSEWPGFSTWTKFQAEPGPLDEAIFDPLYTWSDSISTPAYGRITESPQDYILSLGWNSPEAYQEFKTSPEYQQLMTNLGITLTQDHTRIIIFENHNFGSTSTPNTEILTVYWPLSLSPETQNAIWEVEPLVHTPMSETLGRRCYKQPPVFGWADEPQIWNSDKALASVWVHDWKSEALEDRFKRTEKRVVSIAQPMFNTRETTLTRTTRFEASLLTAIMSPAAPKPPKLQVTLQFTESDTGSSEDTMESGTSIVVDTGSVHTETKGPMALISQTDFVETTNTNLSDSVKKLG